MKETYEEKIQQSYNGKIDLLPELLLGKPKKQTMNTYVGIRMKMIDLSQFENNKSSIKSFKALLKYSKH